MRTQWSSLRRTLEWLERNLDRALALEDIAKHAAMSVRSLNRHFREQTGTTPLQWILRARVRRAQQLLETGTAPVELIATRVGFGSSVAFREQFQRIVGTSPRAYRRSFQSR